MYFAIFKYEKAVKSNQRVREQKVKNIWLEDGNYEVFYTFNFLCNNLFSMDLALRFQISICILKYLRFHH